MELTLHVVVHHVRVGAEQNRVDGHTRLAERDGKILGNPDHGRRDYIVEGTPGPRTAVRIGDGATKERAYKKLVPVELAFPIVRAIWRSAVLPRAIRPGSIPLV